MKSILQALSIAGVMLACVMTPYIGEFAIFGNYKKGHIVLHEFGKTTVFSKQKNPSVALRREIVAEKGHSVPDYTLTYIPQGKGIVSMQKGPLLEEDLKEWNSVVN